MRKPTITATPPSFAALAQAFFAEHLTQQRAMSPRTVAAYRDAFVLFLDFAQARLHKPPTAIRLAQITPALILGFLDHLEHERGNTLRTRNARLAALRAFLKFAGHRDVTQRLELAVKTASLAHPRLADRHVSPHTIRRHTTAMHLLQSSVDISVIALWLGHESPTTTHQYVESDLAMKERALSKLKEPEAAIRRYHAPDSLMDFLKTL